MYFVTKLTRLEKLVFEKVFASIVYYATRKIIVKYDDCEARAATQESYFTILSRIAYNIFFNVLSESAE